MANLQDSIATENAAFLAALARGDAAGMAATYTEDGQAFSPPMPML